MDADRLDSVIRAMAAAPSRRATLSLALGGVLTGLTRETAHAKNKKNKGKGKKKGCPKGQKKCDNTCIANTSCCYRHDCEAQRGCTNEECSNGTCQCAPELIMHNGVCGFLIPCLSFGEPCTTGNDCCGNTCRDDGSGQLRCLGKSVYQCMTDLDCANGPCRGFLCPEALAPYYSLCNP